MLKNNAVSKDVAIDELEVLINKFVKKPVSKDKLEETYPDILDAIMDGLLTFNEESIPVFKLKEPIKNADGEVSVSEINFRTRIKPTTLADLASGLHPQNEVFKLQLRMVSYIIDQPIAMLDKFGRYDYDVISQVAAVFS